jgi:hypothetical protein
MCSFCVPSTSDTTCFVSPFHLCHEPYIALSFSKIFRPHWMLKNNQSSHWTQFLVSTMEQIHSPPPPPNPERTDVIVQQSVILLPWHPREPHGDDPPQVLAALKREPEEEEEGGSMQDGASADPVERKTPRN